MTRASDLAKLLTGGRTLGGTGEVIVKDIDTADGSSPKITLQTGDTDIASADVLGTIDFQAPDEGTGTDAILVAAGIEAVSEGDFSSSSNATSLVFKTGASEAAAEKVRITSAGNVGIGDSSPESNTNYTALTVTSTSGSGGGQVYVQSSSVNSVFGADNSGSDPKSILQTVSNHPLQLGTNNTQAMRIDGSGHITMPLQPAFLSKMSSDQTNIPVYTETTINFDTEIFDQNADYNNSTYTFTAPVTGRYQLQVHLYFREVNKDYAYAYMLLKTSNRNHAIETDPGIFDEDAAFSMTLAQLCDMDANDTAFITVQFPNTGSAQADIHSYSEFSGYLVC